MSHIYTVTMLYIWDEQMIYRLASFISSEQYSNVIFFVKYVDKYFAKVLNFTASLTRNLRHTVVQNSQKCHFLMLSARRSIANWAKTLNSSWVYQKMGQKSRNYQKLHISAGPALISKTEGRTKTILWKNA